MKRYFIYKHPLFGRGENWRNPASIRSTKTGVRWDKSPYFIWFQCLLRNNEYEQYCAAGKGDFKKIYENLEMFLIIKIILKNGGLMEIEE